MIASNAETWIAYIQAYLADTRKNVLLGPNESALVRKDCHRQIEFLMAKLKVELSEGECDAIRGQVQDAWKAINALRAAAKGGKS